MLGANALGIDDLAGMHPDDHVDENDSQMPIAVAHAFRAESEQDVS